MRASARASTALALEREPAWESFLRGRLLREEDVARLTKIANVARALNLRESTSNASRASDGDERRAREARRTMRATMRHHGSAVCETLLGALANVGAVEATEHVLALVDVVANPSMWDEEELVERNGEACEGAVMLATYDGRDAGVGGATMVAVDGAMDAMRTTRCQRRWQGQRMRTRSSSRRRARGFWRS